MRPKFNAFAKPQQLNLSNRDRSRWLQPLQNFLCDHPTEFGQVLLGIKDGPWRVEHVKEIETLIARELPDEAAMVGYLSILHEAALHWSAHTRRKVQLPHFLPRKRDLQVPFSRDYAAATSVCKEWKNALSQWIGQPQDGGLDPAMRDRRLGALLISAILHGAVFGVSFLVALVRAIPEWKRRTFIIGRVHIELSLVRQGVTEAERRIWLPDPLTATLWGSLAPTDADQLLAPFMRDGNCRFPSDAVVFRRIGRLIDQLRVGNDGTPLPGIEELRQSAQEVALGECSPVWVAYNNTQLHSEPLRRGDVGRLFPGVPMLEFDTPPDTASPTAAVNAGDQDAAQPEPPWMDRLLTTIQSKALRKALSDLVAGQSVPEALRLVADFGIALDRRTPLSGTSIPATKIADKVILIARSLGHTLDTQNLATLDPVARRTVYLDAINQQPVRSRRNAVQAVIDFDMYLVAQSSDALPVRRNSLPWLPRDGSVDPNLITHAEYFRILDRIEAAWSARRGERQRKMVRLLIVLAFRCGLRRGEIRGLRIEDLLVLGFPELQIRYRKEDPLKTRNAERRFPIEVLLTDSEWQELWSWLLRRRNEGAKAMDYLFSIAERKRIPISLFGSLNDFLRKETRYANEGKGIHLHHLRHAAGAWLFASLMFADSENIESLFPQLHETHLRLRDGKSLRQHLYGHTTQSRKDPFVVASFCGHGSFDTTASSYINIFAWLVAFVLDGIESMRPDVTLVRNASRLPATTFRQWFRKGDIHYIPAQLLARQGARVRADTDSQSSPKDIPSAHLQIENDWLTPAWQRLMRRGRGEAEPNPTLTTQAMFARADGLRNCKKGGAHARHPFEMVSERHNSTTRVSIAVPLMSGRAKTAVDSKLLGEITRMNVEDGKLLSKAVGIFAIHHERDGFVRFGSISELGTADLYIKFLLGQGFGKRELELTSGDADTASVYRSEWRRKLSATNLLISSCPSGRNYGPKTALWIRPKLTALTKRDTSAAGFRFIMAMAFIVFGTIPVDATLALPAPAAVTA